MRSLVLTTLLVGCSKGPETDINPNPTPVSTPIPAENIHLTCTVPTPSVKDEIAIYDLDVVLDSSGCVWGETNPGLHFVPEATAVKFSCNSDAFTWYSCDLPLVYGISEHHFTFGKMDGDETKYEPFADPKILTECAGHEFSLIFWSTREGGNTLCGDDQKVDRGFQDVFFGNRSARIVLKGPL